VKERELLLNQLSKVKEDLAANDKKTKAAAAMMMSSPSSGNGAGGGCGGGRGGGGGGGSGGSGGPHHHNHRHFNNMKHQLYNDDSMQKARTRFITAVRAQYQANHHLGRMKASVLRTLRESADRQLDDPSVSFIVG
jgi:hypothetical protein